MHNRKRIINPQTKIKKVRENNNMVVWRMQRQDDPVSIFR